MTPKLALLTVATWGLVFATIGAVLGGGIGLAAPDYYRTVFRNSDTPGFEPLQVGVGLGATQGLATGIMLSIVVLGLLAWRDARIARPVDRADDTQPRLRSWTVHAVWGIVTAMCVVAVSGVTFLLGGITGQQQLYQAWTDQKLERLETILADEQYADLEADYSSAAQVYLTGEVRDDETLQTLRAELITQFGRDEAEDILRPVELRQ